MDQKFYRAIIIEDENLAIGRLKNLLKKHEDQISIIEECESGEEGVQKINALKPDLIFLDIAMPGLNGFEMLSKLEHIPWVIFTTAFDQYAIRAFEENSIDYLLKPIEPERLKASINKLIRLKEAGRENNLAELTEVAEKLKSRKEIIFIPIKIGNKILLIKLEDIVAFEAKDRFVYLYTLNGNEHLVDLTLAVLEAKLPENFMRIRHSGIVNVNHIRELKKDQQGGFELIMNDKGSLKIKSGPNYINRIRELLNI